MSLPPERPGYTAPADLAERRAGLAAAVAAGYWRTDPAPQESMFAGARCLRFSPSNASRGTLLHMHGGAFRIGCPEQIAPFAAALAEACAIDIICPAYRLAPEHPFPAGLCDGWSVVKMLKASGTDPLVISGDSAGGGLAAGLVSLCYRGSIKITGLALLSPWLDLTASNESYTANAALDPLFSAEAAREAAELYLQGHSPFDSFASPLRGPVTGYPPTYINVGTGEVLSDDALHFYDRLRSACVTAELHRVDNMEHVAVTRDGTLTGAAETFDALKSFVDRVLA